MVRQPCETKLDASAIDDRHHLADHLSDHLHQLRRRARAMDAGKSSRDCCPPVRDQSPRKYPLHTNSVRNAKPPLGRIRYSHRLGDDHLVRDRHLAASQVGRRRASSLLRLGLYRNLAAALDHHPQLGEITSRFLCSINAARFSTRCIAFQIRLQPQCIPNHRNIRKRHRCGGVHRSVSPEQTKRCCRNCNRVVYEREK